MIYYAIFCITTTIMILWKCQIPAWKIANDKRRKAFIFWPTLIFFDLLLAPFFFVVLLAMPDIYKNIIVEKLKNGQSN
jgi:hypothetical protein